MIKPYIKSISLFLLAFFIFFSILINLSFINAVITVISPANYTNYSGTSGNIVFNVSYVNGTDFNDAKNVTFYYNLSGTWTVIGSGLACSNGATFASCNATLNISSLTPGKYGINASLGNTTGGTFAAVLTHVIIFDSTAPNVTSYSNTVNTGNYSGTIVLNASCVDNVIGVNSVYFNVTYPNGTQLNFTQALSLSGTDYNISLITTGFLDGNYNITAFANDSLNNLNRTEFIQVTFDNTPPNVSNFTDKVNNGNYTGSIVLNATADDVTTSISAVYFNITHPNGTLVNFTQASKSGISYNLIVSTSTFTDGLYNITISANDSANSRNNSRLIQVRFDNTNPSATMSCTPANVNVGDTVTCTCSPSDSGGSGINPPLTVYTASPSTSSTGTFTQTCTFKDLAGNSGSATSSSYTVELSGGGGSSSGGGGGGGAAATSFYKTTIPKSGQEFNIVQSINQELKVKERIKIKINNEMHFVGVRELTSTSATIEITSTPVQVKLNVGEDTKVDVNNDNFYDVYAKLNSISNNKADLTINYLHEAIIEETVEEPEEKVEEPVLAPPEEKQLVVEEKKSLLWLWITIGVIIVTIVLFLIYQKRHL